MSDEEQALLGDVGCTSLVKGLHFAAEQLHHSA